MLGNLAAHYQIVQLGRKHRLLVVLPVRDHKPVQSYRACHQERMKSLAICTFVIQRNYLPA